ncbi:uncharacterized protein N7479_003749 [Penicillium vulpinum]|uniref:Heterokaryon incompatibility domain-containing protein n=1 Tax=Penicillium vulpinum TaxID=29845 RepID=A0A1V6RSJ1_9EURO|nr:uncharacterized protein N7479_003749 [Penicillium vulpinum]KAJ5963873.1 hypothetical protein N7479_003749 [Penicillium vulpinum]OQE04500.1 hypothetical protein PENVUL_c032G04047 [Penicillium vulpinum]
MSSSFDIPLVAFRNRCLDISALGTECRFRLVDCERFLHDQVLQVTEFSDVPPVDYSTISYPWRGNECNATSLSVGGTFSVAGAEDGDPVSMDVLMHACTFSSTSLGVRYLWLDRVCIMQTNPQDKHWQIRRMYRIYKECKACIVLPGGLGRLVRLDEETAWIHRGWTLQEALAPDKVDVLFAWKAGSGTFVSADHSGVLSEVVAKQSARAPLRDLIQASAVGYMLFSCNSMQVSRFPVQVRIFGSSTPNARALAGLLSEDLAADDEIRDHAIWKSAFQRTSSRPVDMVYSIMGLFGISLDPGAFHNDDRAGATIALAREIVNSGRCASWLGIAFRVPPSKDLSTFPIFPMTSVQGSAMILVEDVTLDVAGLVDDEYPNTLGLCMGMPRGTMDGHGYLNFTAKSISVVRVHPKANEDPSTTRQILALNNTIWEEDEEIAKGNGESSSLPITYAVVLGWFDEYHPGATVMDNPAKIKLMIVEEHGSGQFHLVTYAAVDYRLRGWVKTWINRQFCLGGPAAASNHGSDQSMEPNRNCNTARWNALESPSNRDIQATLARWAAPQEALESLISR